MPGAVRIYDTTLSQRFAWTGPAVSVDQATAIARVLEQAGVSTIEAGHPAQSPAQRALVTTVAKSISASQVAALAACDPADIAAALDAVRHAAKPLVHVYLPSDPARSGGKRVEWCRAIEKAVTAVRAEGIEAQFSIDGMEAMERPFRRQCIGVAINAGATRIAVPDGTGTAKTAAYTEMVRDIVQFVESRAIISACCHNSSGQAVHHALAAVEAGARQVETTAIGSATGCTPLKDFVEQARGRFDVVSVDLRAAASISALIPANSAPAPAQSGAAEREIEAPATPVPDWYCRVEVAAL